jgi:hypothetical protein
MYVGEECFIIMLFCMINGTLFTEMACHTFWGGLHCLSKMYQVMINHLYLMFCNTISRTSMDQWIPLHLNCCCRLIYAPLSDGALEEVEFQNGEVDDRHWILHHFHFDSFYPFGFHNDFAVPMAQTGSWA